MLETLENAGFKDPGVGALLFKALDVPTYEFTDPVKFQRLQDIASFLNDHPDPQWVIDRVHKNRTNMSKLDFIASYVHLARNKNDLQTKLSKVEKDMRFYE